MTDTTLHASPNWATTLNLLTYYCIEPDQPHTKVKLLGRWLRTYPEQWVRWALIESLYQGRYKPHCVEQILALWHRRGQPVYHFNHEFETMICHNVPYPIGKEAATRAVRVGVKPQRSPAANLTPATPEPALASSAAQNDSPQTPETEQGAEPRVDPLWQETLESVRPDTFRSVLDQVLEQHQLLPLSLGRLGLEPIHQFMPAAEPIEFCEKLAAIALSSR